MRRVNDIYIYMNEWMNEGGIKSESIRESEREKEVRYGYKYKGCEYERRGGCKYVSINIDVWI